MAKKKNDKDKEPEKPTPTRSGLRSQGKKDNGIATPDPSDSARPTPTPAPPPPPKRGTKRAHAEFKDDYDYEENKEWLESERKRREDLVRRAEAAASIPHFARELRNREDARRDSNRAGVAKANKEVGGPNNFDPGTRDRKHRARRNETYLYEDFIYFQTPRRRTQYSEHILKRKNEKANPFRKNQAVGKLWRHDSEEDKQLREIVEELEARRIGTLEDVGARARGPNELHTLIPTRTRRAIGLGRDDLELNTPAVILRIDAEAIERRRAEIEDQHRDEVEDVERGPVRRMTHTERRAEEARQMREAGMPTKWHVNHLVPTAVSFDRTRLESGLFIAAGETSKDWLDSYDSLDKVKSGVYAIESRLMRPDYIPPTEDEEEDEPQPDPAHPGVLNEFIKDKVPHKKYRHILTTEWTEAAFGRREREFINMFLPPPSPVESPPRSPLPRANIPSDIPSSHPKYNFYRAKFRDHHGVMFKQWSNLPLDVPYGPIDVAALPKSLQAKYAAKEDELGDPEIMDEFRTFHGPAPDGTSMRLLREAKKMKYTPPTRPKKKKQGPWADDYSSSSSDDDSDGEDGDSSEDEGDLFRKAYLQASGVVQGGGGGGDGGTGGTGGPEGPPGPGEPGDEFRDDDKGDGGGNGGGQDDGADHGKKGGKIGGPGTAKDQFVVLSSESSDPSSSDDDENMGDGNENAGKGVSNDKVDAEGTAHNPHDVSDSSSEKEDDEIDENEEEEEGEDEDQEEDLVEDESDSNNDEDMDHTIQEVDRSTVS